MPVSGAEFAGLRESYAHSLNMTALLDQLTARALRPLDRQGGAAQPFSCDFVPLNKGFREKRRDQSRRNQIDDGLGRDVSFLAAEEGFDPGDCGETGFRVEALFHVDPLFV